MFVFDAYWLLLIVAFSLLMFGMLMVYCSLLVVVVVVDCLLRF